MICKFQRWYNLIAGHTPAILRIEVIDMKGILIKLFGNKNRSNEEIFNSLRINALVKTLADNGCITQDEYDNNLGTEVKRVVGGR